MKKKGDLWSYIKPVQKNNRERLKETDMQKGWITHKDWSLILHREISRNIIDLSPELSNSTPESKHGKGVLIQNQTRKEEFFFREMINLQKR